MSVSHVLPLPAVGGPFDLADGDAYARWRDSKLDSYPSGPEALLVEVTDAGALSDAEHAAILGRVRKANMALYAGGPADTADRRTILGLARRFGLDGLDPVLCADPDGLTPLHVAAARETRRQRYIPYTDRPIRWHTDGYYNQPDRQIHGLFLHCASDAADGGGNALMDHEVAYILVREENPDWVRALMHPHAMTIPPNDENGVEIRAARTGPVFSVDPASGCLHMRYTQRKRNVAWRDDPATVAAVAFLERLLDGESPYVFRHRLAPGQGLVSNNVLHDRAGFADGPAKTRLIYRARYHSRLAGTDFEETRPR